MILCQTLRGHAELNLPTLIETSPLSGFLRGFGKGPNAITKPAPAYDFPHKTLVSRDKATFVLNRESEVEAIVRRMIEIQSYPRSCLH
jgi:hypothetical protein